MTSPKPEKLTANHPVSIRMRDAMKELCNELGPDVERWKQVRPAALYNTFESELQALGPTWKNKARSKYNSLKAAEFQSRGNHFFCHAIITDFPIYALTYAAACNFYTVLLLGWEDVKSQNMDTKRIQMATEQGLHSPSGTNPPAYFGQKVTNSPLGETKELKKIRKKKKKKKEKQKGVIIDCASSDIGRLFITNPDIIEVSNERFCFMHLELPNCVLPEHIDISISPNGKALELTFTMHPKMLYPPRLAATGITSSSILYQNIVKWSATRKEHKRDNLTHKFVFDLPFIAERNTSADLFNWETGQPMWTREFDDSNDQRNSERCILLVFKESNNGFSANRKPVECGAYLEISSDAEESY